MGQLATVACIFLILALFRLSRDRNARTSYALWLPTFWFLIAGSRNVSEWLNMNAPMDAVDRYMEGSPVDRNILSLLMFVALVVLVGRSQRVRPILKANLPIILYFGFCGLSMIWSDFPLVCGKRWLRSLGDILMALVVLTDPDSRAALKAILPRVGFVLLPLSILFIRYYPVLGRTYGNDGSLYWTGVATGKNSLGMICLVFGLASMWNFVLYYKDRQSDRRKSKLIAFGLLISMAVYLLWIADSKTSLASFVLVSCLFSAAQLKSFERKPLLLKFCAVGIIVSAFSVLFLGIGSSSLQAIGRDPTLTGRTDVWKLVLSFAVNPVVGAGYESFWMGQRLLDIVAINGGVNQAHNGYIEVYLNLGFVGIFLLAGIIISAYRGAFKAFKTDRELGMMKVAYFVVAVVYNFTEGSFKMFSPIWLSFILATLALPLVEAEQKTATINGDEANMRNEDYFPSRAQSEYVIGASRA